MGKMIMNRDVLVTFWETDLKDEYLETFANKAKTNPSLNTTRFNVQFVREWIFESQSHFLKYR